MAMNNSTSLCNIVGGRLTYARECAILVATEYEKVALIFGMRIFELPIL
jgi:hypothetical protein